MIPFMRRVFSACGTDSPCTGAHCSSVALLVYWYIFLIDVLAAAKAFSFLFNY